MDIYLEYVPKKNDYIDVISNEIIKEITDKILYFIFDPNTNIITLNIYNKINNKIYNDVMHYDKSSENADDYNIYYCI